MATESNLQKVHVFPSEESYEQNKNSVGNNDIALVPGGEVLEVILNMTSETSGTSNYSSQEIYKAVQDGKFVYFKTLTNAIFQFYAAMNEDMVAGQHTAVVIGRTYSVITDLVVIQGTSVTISRTTANYSTLGAAAESHNHSASNITSGILSIARGGTGVSNMTGTDYTTNRPRGIVLQASTPSTVPNGCIVGVYE